MHGTYLGTTLTVLPALVPQAGEATLLGGNALLLLERRTKSACGDLGVLVVPAELRAGAQGPVTLVPAHRTDRRTEHHGGEMKELGREV